MSRLPRLAVGRHVSARNDGGISLDGFIMHDPGMTSRTTFLLSTDFERLHMKTMAHDEPHFFHR